MRWLYLLKTALFAGLAVSVAALAQEPDPWQTLYADCRAACHDASGMGDGDMANVVNIPLPNLTLPAKNNGGVFPMLDVLQVNDSRSGTRAHGGVMPLWRRVFLEEVGDRQGDYGGVLEGRGRVLSLADHLGSIQQNQERCLPVSHARLAPLVIQISLVRQR